MASVKGRQRWLGGTACAEGWGSSPVPEGTGAAIPPERAQLVMECLAHGCLMLLLCLLWSICLAQKYLLH